MLKPIIKKIIKDSKGKEISVEVIDVKIITTLDSGLIYSRYFNEDRTKILTTSKEFENIVKEFRYLYTIIYNEKTKTYSASRIADSEKSIVYDVIDMEDETKHSYCPAAMYKIIIKSKEKLDNYIYESKNEKNIFYTKLLNLGYIDPGWINERNGYYIYEMITNPMEAHTSDYTHKVLANTTAKILNLDSGFLFDMRTTGTENDPKGFIKGYENLLKRIKFALTIDENIFK